MHSMSTNHSPAPDARQRSPLRLLAIVALWATFLGTLTGCISGDHGSNYYNANMGYYQRNYDSDCGRGSPRHSSQTDIAPLIGFVIQKWF